MNPPLTADESRLALAVGAAAVAVLPSPEPLAPTTPHPGTAEVTGSFAAAVVAELDGSAGQQVVVLVGEQLVAALASSPIGELDLASALQPTVDAMAGALGARAGAARELALEQVRTEVTGPFTVVPLSGGASAAALLVPDAALRAVGGEAPGTPPFLSPVAAVAPVPTPVPVAAAPVAARGGIELLHGVDMEVTVEIGRARMTVRELLDLSPGAVLELDRAAGSPADLLVNGRLIARGEVVVVDEDFGLRITEIVTDSAVG